MLTRKMVPEYQDVVCDSALLQVNQEGYKEEVEWIGWAVPPCAAAATDLLRRGVQNAQTNWQHIDLVMEEVYHAISNDSRTIRLRQVGVTIDELCHHVQ